MGQFRRFVEATGYGYDAGDYCRTYENGDWDWNVVVVQLGQSGVFSVGRPSGGVCELGGCFRRMRRWLSSETGDIASVTFGGGVGVCLSSGKTRTRWSFGG